jgi:pentatricopeptide repeat protein
VNAQALAASFDSPSGFAAVMKGMFKNGKAKKAHALWTSAQRKGVHDAVELRFATHESFGYAVIAFSVNGPLDLPTRENLAAQADRFPLGTIRYEALPYSSLMPLGWHPRNYDPNDHTIEALGDPHPGVFVFVTTTSPKGPDRPYVAHCVVDGKDYVYPIPGERLR